MPTTLKASLPVDSEKVKANVEDFGANGFFLSFNPDSDAKKYSGSAVSTNPALIYEVSPGALFNGDDTDGVKYDGTGSDNSLTCYLSSSIQTTGKITVKYNGQGASRTIQFNYEAPQAFIIGSGSNYRQIELDAPTEITRITFQDFEYQGASANVVGFYVDDELLVDLSPAGYDSSGNENHFTDENFQTQPAHVYSRNITYQGEYFNGTAEEIFDGNSTNTKLVITQKEGIGWIKWTGVLDNVESLAVYTERNGYIEVTGPLGTIQAIL